EWSYRELQARAAAVAAEVRASGIGADEVVGVCVERSAAMLATLLGVLQAGAAYLPLEPGYPPERLRYMLWDSQARLVLTQASVREVVESVLPEGVSVRLIDEAVRRGPA